MADYYRTIEGFAEAEIVEKKSRFIGQLTHVETEEEALAFLEEIRAKHRMARHNVYAYVLRGGRVRYSDDGEPGGTSGMPTLETLQHAGLQDVAIVTTRYFGGVLLGTGGLVRAYTAAAQAAIDAAQVVVISRCVDISLTIPYNLYEAVNRLAGECEARVMQADFGTDVALQLRMLEGTEAPLLERLSEITRGQATPQVSAPFDAAF